MINNFLLIALSLLITINLILIFNKREGVLQIGSLFTFIIQTAFLMLAFYDNRIRINTQTVDMVTILALLILGNCIILFGYIKKQKL